MLAILPVSLLLLVATFVSAETASQVPPAPSSSFTSLSSVPASVTLTITSTPSFSGSANVPASSTITAAYPSLSDYSSCVDDCLDQAIADAGCDSIVDVNCFCSSTNVTAFSASLTSCMAKGCPASLSPAEGLANQFCALASASTSISFVTTSFPSSVLTSSSASSSTPTSSPVSKSSTAPKSSATSSSSASSTGSAGASSAAEPAAKPGLALSLAAGLGFAVLGVVFG